MGVSSPKDAAPHSDQDQRRRGYPAPGCRRAESTTTSMASTTTSTPHHRADIARNVGRVRTAGGQTPPGSETGSEGYPSGYPTDRHGHIDTARRERGFTGDNITKWRGQYKNHKTYLCTETARYLEACRKHNWHPAELKIETLLNWIQDEVKGQHKTYLAVASAVAQHGYGTQPFRGNPDVQLGRNTQDRELADMRGEFPICDANELYVQIFREIAGAGGIQRCRTGPLLEAITTLFKLEMGWRNTGLAEMPWYRFRREPATASIILAPYSMSEQ